MYKYEHGGDIYTEKTAANGKAFVDFSANINPLGLPKGVKTAINDALKDCVNYPDPFCRELAAATAAYLGVTQDKLFFGNGAADILFRLALAMKPKQALIFAPTFADYEKALHSVKCHVRYYNLDPEHEFLPQKDIVRQITPRIGMVILCNPNNPTGQVMSKILMERILFKCRQVGAILVVDECFMDFVDEQEGYSLRDLLDEYPELVILKAYTKTFAMPGIRLGYCLSGNEALLNALHENGQDWSVSILAQAAGIAALQEQGYLEKTKQLISEERSYLKKQLTDLGARVYGSQANYIFFYLPQPANLAALLRKQGFLIRSCANYVNLGEGYYRIAVKLRVENRALINALKDILEKEGAL